MGLIFKIAKQDAYKYRGLKLTDILSVGHMLTGMDYPPSYFGY